MIRDRSVLAVIPARGGSVGLPKKNVRVLAGKPLLAWSIGAARKSKAIDRLVVSSEDDEIMEIARAWGCEVPFRRPEELAGDGVPIVASVIHCIEALEEKYDYAVLLQCTSPLRTGEDIDGAVETCVRKGAPCISLSEPPVSPYWMFTLDGSGGMAPLTGMGIMDLQRQRLPEAYGINGAVYVAETTYLRTRRAYLTEDTVPFIMPPERSIDIDSQLDFHMCEYLLTHRSMEEP